MIYREPGIVLFGSSPTPFPPLPSVSSTGDTQEDRERKVADGRGAKIDDGEKARSSKHHSILAGGEEGLACNKFVNEGGGVWGMGRGGRG
jgi:hypothetical protein